MSLHYIFMVEGRPRPGSAKKKTALTVVLAEFLCAGRRQWPAVPGHLFLLDHQKLKQTQKIVCRSASVASSSGAAPSTGVREGSRPSSGLPGQQPRGPMGMPRTFSQSSDLSSQGWPPCPTAEPFKVQGQGFGGLYLSTGLCSCCSSGASGKGCRERTAVPACPGRLASEACQHAVT